MRWSIRYQLLVPPLTLLLGVIGVSTWTALASVDRARGQIETQVRNVARTLGESSVGLSHTVLKQMNGLSGAEFLLVAPHERLSTFDDAAVEPPEGAVSDDWH